MSKELTEQWRNGTLPFGMYYVKSTYGDIRIDETVYLVGRKRYRWRYTDICCLEEVLAPVPSYEQDKLNEDTVSDLLWKLELSVQSEVNLTKKVEKLEKQLNEANAIIKSLKDARSQSVKEYLEKYGVENEQRTTRKNDASIS